MGRPCRTSRWLARGWSGRAVALVRVPSSDVGLYGTVSAGYALAFDQPSVSVSLAFVVF